MASRIRSILIHYMFGIGLALLITPIVEGFLWILPDIGWHFLTVLYSVILLLQVVFYYLASYHSLRWTVLNFVVNYVLWVFEQVQIEQSFGDSFIYQGEKNGVYVLVLGAILWVTNKLLFDAFLFRNKLIVRRPNRLDILVTKWSVK